MCSLLVESESLLSKNEEILLIQLESFAKAKS